MSESDKAIADYSSAYDNARKEKASQCNIAEILGSRTQVYYKQGNDAKTAEFKKWF